MKTMNAADANRYFSRILKEVATGEQVVVVSRGKPVAKIVPIRDDYYEREAARRSLLSRLKTQPPDGQRTWVRNELYE